ncbi:MAG: hypothetical protein APR63_09190 [Desulfuromonas sp. SDB]|nr:MAG: hypothetical protein APR63_09190 [Desulfuromonas sp. SDB]
MNNEIDKIKLDKAFELLNFRLTENKSDLVEIVVCGGSALIYTGLITRTTKDVDIVALMKKGILSSPDPLPDVLIKSFQEVAEDLGLDDNWINNAVSRGEGGLFQLGLPDYFQQRLISRDYGEKLKVHFISRIDQIYFKLYASVDRGGYHINDLLKLEPNDDELLAASRWVITHDVSLEFLNLLKNFLVMIGYEKVSGKL